jgi:hypothetical protein
MRDKGVNFYRYDPLCDNLFADSFDADLTRNGQFALVTAFEVFEHLTQPLVEIQEMLRFAPGIFFSTVLLPPGRPKPQEWWYFGLEHGQHVSIFTRRSLEVVAERLGLKLNTNGHSYHLLTDKSVSPFLFRLAVSSRFSHLLNMVVRRQSLLEEDYFRITGRKLG